MSLSSILGSSFGFFVIYFVITFCWWKIHICVGISQNHPSNHLLQSQTIPIISNHFDCKKPIHSLYLSFVSYHTLYRSMFLPVSSTGSRILKIIYPYFLQKYVVSIKIMTFHGSICSQIFFEINTINSLLNCWYTYFFIERQLTILRIILDVLIE